MKKYVVSVEEMLSRAVVVEAEDVYDAEDKVEEMCNNGIINLTAEDFADRNVNFVREAEDMDLQNMTEYKVCVKKMKITRKGE